ncbi:alpha/beta hydrolase family protein [Plantibacter sp. YIM 135347]|uniref:alpha/beta hydrolase family protein n=1 Tax=Plantibacter sp. YIM 135347 TaxID=3423919 RepID=UPI003D34D7A8
MQPESKLLLDRTRLSWSRPAEARPIRARIWPSSAPGQSGVILLSHGTGGAGEDLDWLARPLSDAGFLVASVDHHGNSYNDEYLVEGFALAWERPRDLSVLLDHLIEEYDVDVERVGSIGFSLGGYTVAALLGAHLNGEVMDALFRGLMPVPEVPEFPDLINVLRAKYSDAELTAMARVGEGTVCDRRVRAGVLLAPALGSAVDADSLRRVESPVLIRWGEGDDNTPPDQNAHIYQALIPRASGASVGADVGHYVFLGDRDDVSEVRERVAAESIEFFAANL